MPREASSNHALLSALRRRESSTERARMEDKRKERRSAMSCAGCEGDTPLKAAGVGRTPAICLNCKESLCRKDSQ
eukprot:10278546-Prorocentrum_lima.AAC.1